ncbi:MAG: hypothetical protein JWM68_786 [Verrucomicrobiales bacterium]|nr:hypothetical protein [Verrucomicrobiales bacterium]
MKEKIFIPPTAPEIKLLQDHPQAFKRILIMEENPEVAKKIQRFLEARHFDVFFAKSAVAALREIIDSDFDVIICDMIKPSFSGQMFHVAVGRVKPYLCNRFIFATGRSTSSATAAFIKEVNGVMLWRPFETHILLETIYLVLQKQTAPVKTKSVDTRPPVRVARRVRNTNAENLRFLQLSLAGAMKSIRIVSSYFVYDDAMMKSMLEASVRGVKVELFVSDKDQGQTGDPKVQDCWGKLLAAGVKIFITKDALEPGRLMVCDDTWVCFTRSNFTATNLNIYHGEFTARFLRTIEAQKKNFEQIRAVSKLAMVAPRKETAVGGKAAENFYSKFRGLFSGMMSLK